MQSITTLMSAFNLHQQSYQPKAVARPRHTENTQFVQIFSRFFECLKVIFPASIAVLKTAAEISNFKSQWVTAFKENNIDSELKINAGLRIARQQQSPFLPSVGQFIAWCEEGLSAVYGLPTPQELYAKLQAYCRIHGHDDATDFDYGSDANYWLVHDLYSVMTERRLGTKEVEDKAKELISQLTKKILNGYVVPKPCVAIRQNNTSTPTSREQALENIRKIKEKCRFSLNKVIPCKSKPNDLTVTEPACDNAKAVTENIFGVMANLSHVDAQSLSTEHLEIQTSPLISPIKATQTHASIDTENPAELVTGIPDVNVDCLPVEQSEVQTNQLTSLTGINHTDCQADTEHSMAVIADLPHLDGAFGVDTACNEVQIQKKDITGGVTINNKQIKRLNTNRLSYQPWYLKFIDESIQTAIPPLPIDTHFNEALYYILQAKRIAITTDQVLNGFKLSSEWLSIDSTCVDERNNRYPKVATTALSNIDRNFALSKFKPEKIHLTQLSLSNTSGIKFKAHRKPCTRFSRYLTPNCTISKFYENKIDLIDEYQNRKCHIDKSTGNRSP